MYASRADSCPTRWCRGPIASAHKSRAICTCCIADVASPTLNRPSANADSSSHSAGWCSPRCHRATCSAVEYADIAPELHDTHQHGRHSHSTRALTTTTRGPSTAAFAPHAPVAEQHQAQGAGDGDPAAADVHGWEEAAREDALRHRDDVRVAALHSTHTTTQRTHPSAL
jgi:hypothetical protein